MYAPLLSVHNKNTNIEKLGNRNDECQINICCCFEINTPMMQFDAMKKKCIRCFCPSKTRVWSKTKIYSILLKTLRYFGHVPEKLHTRMSLNLCVWIKMKWRHDNCGVQTAWYLWLSLLFYLLKCYYAEFS